MWGWRIGERRRWGRFCLNLHGREGGRGGREWLDGRHMLAEGRGEDGWMAGLTLAVGLVCLPAFPRVGLEGFACQDERRKYESGSENVSAELTASIVKHNSAFQI